MWLAQGHISELQLCDQRRGGATGPTRTGPLTSDALSVPLPSPLDGTFEQEQTLGLWHIFRLGLEVWTSRVF